MPKLSVVTANKDGLSWLLQTAPTVLAQSLKDFEWVFIDDDSREPVASYIAGLGDPRIRYFRNDSPRGQTWSLNFGIRQAITDWIVRVDGDDLLHPDRFAKTWTAIQAARERARLVFTDYEVIDEQNQMIASVKYRISIRSDASGFTDYLMKRNSPICHPAVAFYRKTSSGNIYEYNEALRNAQDYELWKRIVLDSPDGLVHIPRPLTRYRLVRQSLSGARAGEQKQELEAIRSDNVRWLKNEENRAVLSIVQQNGMQAYRQLYYRFLDCAATSSAVPVWRLVLEALGYRRIFFKSLAYAVARPVRGILKRFVFGGIYF